MGGVEKEGMVEKPDYGNWVSKRLIFLFVILGLASLPLSPLYPFLIVFSAFFLLVSAYFAYARREFSSQGGNVQDQIWDLLLAHLSWDGKGRVLDIGCGNGALAVKLARKYPEALVVGIDSWGKNWEYSKDRCERNAMIEGVGERLSFRKAGASALPFSDGEFDAVVSNLAFHEVKDAKDKRQLIREALRVAKKGGAFAFQDLFSDKRTYGAADDLVRTVQSWGTEKAEFIPTRDADFIPAMLKLPFMVGTIGIIAGRR